MKKINDSNIYLIPAATGLVIALALCIVSFYSILVVEPKVERLFASTENVEKNLRDAYLILRDPQIFAGYGYFDAEGISVKNSLAFFDRRIYNGEEIDPSRKAYLELLLDRRKKGAALGRNTMVFFLILSLVFWGLFIQERIAARR
ncbi:MAG: hypothetical protein JW807_14735 [Spirochaetes bacterium]|nr:hypothetical protein [Spirochaetota bacterium]